MRAIVFAVDLGLFQSNDGFLSVSNTAPLNTKPILDDGDKFAQWSFDRQKSSVCGSGLLRCQILGGAICGAIPSDFKLIIPAPQITPPTTYPNTAPAADQTFDVHYSKLSKIMIARDAPSDDYRHPPCSLTAVRHLIATYRTMAHSLSYHDDFGSSLFLTGARYYYVRTVAPSLHCQSHPNFNVR
jgi:hypothetical protein